MFALYDVFMYCGPAAVQAKKARWHGTTVDKASAEHEYGHEHEHRRMSFVG